MPAIPTPLYVHRFGPPPPLTRHPTILALHGITGHGARWEDWATTEVPDMTVLAPDLLGHGQSPWTPPWSIEAQVNALIDVITSSANNVSTAEPVIVVAHSYGCTLAIHLSRTRPDLVKALVLLDPAIALDPNMLLTLAEQTIAYPDYTSPEQAREDKRSGAWGEVPSALLDKEIKEHLITLNNGRYGWRVSIPAIVATWSELARELVLPAADTPTTIVRALKPQPPYLSSVAEEALRKQLGDFLTVIEVDNDHMIPQACPQLVGSIVRNYLDHADYI
ncbi:MAG: alpha/beta fold hydrolase [Mycobacteriaceae bacterium]